MKIGYEIPKFMKQVFGFLDESMHLSFNFKVDNVILPLVQFIHSLNIFSMSAFLFLYLCLFSSSFFPLLSDCLSSSVNLIDFLLSTLISGTFTTRSTFASLVSFIRDSLAVDWLPFVVIAPSAGGRLSEDEQKDKTLAELGLAPSAVINVTFEDEIVRQCRQSMDKEQDFYFVKDELLSRIERF